MNLLNAAMIAVIAPLSLAATQASGLKIEPVAARVVPEPTALNCILASNVFAQRSTDPKAKAVAENVLYFYLGRLPPQVTPAELRLDLRRTENSLNGMSGAPLMKACALETATKAHMLQLAGDLLRQGK